MKEATHTPGPWFYAETIDGNGYSVFTDLSQSAIAVSVKSNKDARLIAAAPDFFKSVAGEPDLLDQHIDWVSALLASYEQLCDKIGHKPEDYDADWQMRANVRSLVSDVRAAIAKATGQ